MVKENRYETILHRNYGATFAFLRSKLAELHLHIEKEDMSRGEIVARCLTASLNMVFWRTWSDKLVFEIKRLNAAETQVKVFTVPNLFRLNVEKNEEPIELNNLVSQLFN